MARYQLVVLGSGLEDPSHGDHANVLIIVPRILGLNSGCVVFGYVDTAQPQADFEARVDQWETVGVNGIFMDQAGYDFGTPSTNKRKVFNDKVAYIHGRNMKVFANAWNPDHVLGTVNDPSYPNSTWNQPLRATNLDATDWYLMESFGHGPYGPSGELQHEDAAQWQSRGTKITAYLGAVQVAALAQVDEADPAAQDKSDFVLISAMMWGLDAGGTADVFHGAGSAKTTMWTRPAGWDGLAGDYDGGVGEDGARYVRHLTHGRLEVDFGAGVGAVQRY